MSAVVKTLEEVADLAVVADFLETLNQEVLATPHLLAHLKVTMVVITLQLVHIRPVVVVVHQQQEEMLLEITQETVVLVLRRLLPALQ